MLDDTKWRVRLKLIREKRGLSQDDLAKLSGLSQPVISQYERGRRKFKQKTLAPILIALRVTWADIFCGCSMKLRRSSDPQDFNASSLRHKNVVNLKLPQ